MTSDTAKSDLIDAVLDTLPAVADADETKHPRLVLELLGAERVPAQRAIDSALAHRLRANLEAWAHQLADGARAVNTVVALRADLKRWVGWCHAHGHAPLPATQAALLDFIEAMGHPERGLGFKRATVKRYLASIGALHKAAGLPNPVTTEPVKLAIATLARQQHQADQVARSAGEPVQFRTRQAEGLREAALRAATDTYGDNLRDKRDAALLWVAFETLCRISELAAMRVEDFRGARDGGMTVYLPHSKTDQVGDGAYRYVSPYTVGLLECWQAAAEIREGYVFRGLKTVWRRVNGERHRVPIVANALSCRGVQRVIKRAAAHARLDPALFSGHSTRVGAAQDMLEAHIGMLAVQQAGGWKSDAMPQRYAARIDATDGGAAQLARRQGRAPKDSN